MHTHTWARLNNVGKRMKIVSTYLTKERKNGMIVLWKIISKSIKELQKI